MMFESDVLVSVLGTFVVVAIVSFLVYRDATAIDRMNEEAKREEARKAE